MASLEYKQILASTSQDFDGPALETRRSKTGTNHPPCLAKGLAVKQVQTSNMRSNVPAAKPPAVEQKGNHALPLLVRSWDHAVMS